MGSKNSELKKKNDEAGGSETDLRKTGYWGSVVERDHPLNNGFDYALFYNLWECPFYNSELLWENREYTGISTEYNTDLFTRTAINFMEESLDEGKPFFMELALHAVHIPLNVDAPEVYSKHFDTGSEMVDQFYSHIYEVLRKKGRPVPTNDLWIAATALQHGLALYSKDQHFTFIDGLIRFED